MENREEQPHNPWMSMWTQPRTTIQQIIDTNPDKLVYVLAAAAGFSGALDQAVIRGLGDALAWPIVLVIAAIFGPVMGIISLGVMTAVVRWTGHWIGGHAPARNIRAALAWSNVPKVWGLILWAAQIALFRQDLFTTSAPELELHPYLASIACALFGTSIIVSVWSIVALVKCLGQVQGFSAWRALGNLVLGVSVIVGAGITVYFFAIGVVQLYS